MLISEVIIEKETTKNITISKDSWYRIEEELKHTEKNMTKERLKKYAGIIKLTEKPENFQQRIRDEW